MIYLRALFAFAFYSYLSFAMELERHPIAIEHSLDEDEVQILLEVLKDTKTKHSLIHGPGKKLRSGFVKIEIAIPKAIPKERRDEFWHAVEYAFKHSKNNFRTRDGHPLTIVPLGKHRKVHSPHGSTDAPENPKVPPLYRSEENRDFAF